MQQFLYSDAAGRHPYFVYTPQDYQAGTSVPLVVMLHGCTQTALDFAKGTAMNDLAEQHNFIVLYPQQTSHENGNRCWNWFRSDHQQRGSGEPARIVGMIQSIQSNSDLWTIDPARIYVAGLSAGAAMSVILGATYPDVFAAIGVHSGMEYAAASTFLQATKAMNRGGPDPLQQGDSARAAMGKLARVVPTIVFHGTVDRTVAPLNGDQVVQQWMHTNALASNMATIFDYHSPSDATVGQVPGGYTYCTAVWNTPTGEPALAYWQIAGMSHAWSGGRLAGSFTDPRGPDASTAMYDFFMNHPSVRASDELHQSLPRPGLRQLFDSLLRRKDEHP